MDTIKSANLAVRFIVELCALAALAYWGSRTGGEPGVRLAAGIGAPLLAALIWGTFVVPKSAVQLPAPVTVILGLGILALAAAALASAGRPILATAFAVIVVINAALLSVWDQ